MGHTSSRPDADDDDDGDADGTREKGLLVGPFSYRIKRTHAGDSSRRESPYRLALERQTQTEGTCTVTLNTDTSVSASY